MDSIFGMIRFDSQSIDPLDLELLAGDPAETWIDDDAEAAKKPRILWVKPGVALGFIPSQGSSHRQQGEQPWMHPQTGYAITADAHLDNRRQLCAALQLEGVDSDQMHDGQLILLAWLHWGEGCLNHLQGDFTFALWDASRQSLFCVRDRMGARVQGFVKHQNYFAFASDSEWLIRLPGMTGRPSPSGVAEMIDWRFPMLGERSTWRDEVQTVLPGECLAVTREGSVSFRTWWEVVAIKPELYANDDEVEQHFLEVFGAAVKCRMGEQNAAAVLMSGGLDSLAIACTMKSLLSPAARLSSYSGVYDGSEKCVESESIMRLIESLQARAEVIGSNSLSSTFGGDDLFHLAWSRPHPMEASLLVPALCCLSARRAQEATLLHGVSGDIVTAVPWLYMSEHFRSLQWGSAIGECISASDNNVYLRGRGVVWIIGRSLSAAFLPQSARRTMRHLWQAGMRADQPSPLMHQDLHHTYTREKAQRAKESPAKKSFSLPGSGSLYAGLSGFGRIGRRFGLSMRDPWADAAVVQFFLGLPLNDKVRQGWTKYPVRRAFRSQANAEVLWRRDKEHVGWRFTQKVMEASDEYVRDTLNDGLHVIKDFVNIDAVRKLLGQYHPTRSKDSIDLVRGLVTLISWLRR